MCAVLRRRPQLPISFSCFCLSRGSVVKQIYAVLAFILSWSTLDFGSTVADRRISMRIPAVCGANSAEALQNTTRECPSGDLSIERVLGDRVPQRNAAICCRLCAASRCSRVCQGRVFPNGNGNGDCTHTVASYEALGSSPLGAGALGHSSASLHPSLGCASPQM